MKKYLLFLAYLLCVITAQSQTLPRVIILATGGTIAGQGADAEKAGYVPGKIQVEDLIGKIPSAKNVAILSGDKSHQ